MVNSVSSSSAFAASNSRRRGKARSSAANAVRLQLQALAYNLGNFLRTLATPEPIKDWSLTTLKEKLIKIGAKVVSQGRYVTFQMAEVAIPRILFADILRLASELRPPPAVASSANSQRRSGGKRALWGGGLPRRNCKPLAFCYQADRAATAFIANSQARPSMRRGGAVADPGQARRATATSRPNRKSNRDTGDCVAVGKSKPKR